LVARRSRNAGRENLDAGHVSRYDAKEDAGAADDVLVLQRAGLTAESVVVETGTGTGQLAIAVAPVCARVIAVDASDGLGAFFRPLWWFLSVPRLAD
jgi:hypothetical protein